MALYHEVMAQFERSEQWWTLCTALGMLSSAQKEEVKALAAKWREDSYPCFCGEGKRAHDMDGDTHCTCWQCNCKKYRPMVKGVIKVDDSDYNICCVCNAFIKEETCPYCGGGIV